VVIVDPYHLKQVFTTVELDTIALVEIHDGLEFRFGKELNY
jgi:hypothetical protein